MEENDKELAVGGANVNVDDLFEKRYDKIRATTGLGLPDEILDDMRSTIVRERSRKSYSYGFGLFYPTITLRMAISEKTMGGVLLHPLAWGIGISYSHSHSSLNLGPLTFRLDF